MIMKSLLSHGAQVLVTRVDAAKAAVVRQEIPAAVYHDLARALTVRPQEAPRKGRGTIMVVAAGTSDIPVAEEAVITADIMGNLVDRLYDVGVAGLHRLLEHLQQLRRATVFVVVAGLEGALRAWWAAWWTGRSLRYRRASATAPPFTGWRPCWPCSIPVRRGWRW